MQSPRHADDPAGPDDGPSIPLDAPSPAGDNQYSLQSLIDCVPAYLWVKDTHGRFTIANRPIALDYGLNSPEAMIGLDDFDLHDHDMAERFQTIERDLIRTGRPVLDQEEFVVDNAGIKKWRLTSKVPLRNADGVITGLIGISRDITQRKLAAILREGQARIVESIATGASLETTLGQVAALIECQTNGLTAAVFLTDDTRTHLRLGGATSMPPDLVRPVETASAHAATTFWGSTVVHGEAVFTADSTLDPRFDACRDLMASLGFRSCWSIPIRSAHGGILGMILICGASIRVPTSSELQLIELMIRTTAIAIERKQAEDRIQFMATHDSLTNLPNRSVLKDRLSQALLQAEDCGHQVSVVFVDLDNFKFINDSLGHRAGDDLLRHIADRIVSSVRTTDTVVRVGGDEFVLVLSVKPQDNETGTGTIQAVRTAIQEACQIGQHSVSVTSSMGVARYPDDGTDVDVLLAHADAAMYRAKDSGRDAVQFFTPISTRASTRSSLSMKRCVTPSRGLNSRFITSRRSICGRGKSWRSRPCSVGITRRSAP